MALIGTEVKIDNNYFQLKQWATEHELKFTYEDYIKYFYPIFSDYKIEEDEVDGSFNLNMKLIFAKKLFVTLSIKYEEKKALDKQIENERKYSAKVADRQEKRLKSISQKRQVLDEEIKALEEQFVDA